MVNVPKGRRILSPGNPSSHMRSATTSNAPSGTRLPADDACRQLAEKLRRHTQGDVLFDAASRGRYATDASIYQIMPAGVFVPRTADDIETALTLARETAVPVLPRGGGTLAMMASRSAPVNTDNKISLKKSWITLGVSDLFKSSPMAFTLPDVPCVSNRCPSIS